MTALERYGALFSQRDIRRLFAASALGRLPIGLRSRIAPSSAFDRSVHLDDERVARGIGLAAGGALLEVFPSQAALATGAAAALVAAAGARWGLGG
jgi:hypothetical protein